MRKRFFLGVCVALVGATLVGCDDDENLSLQGSGGTSSTGGSAGTGGTSAGNGGSAGSSAGSAGSSAGDGGSAGSSAGNGGSGGEQQSCQECATGSCLDEAQACLGDAECAPCIQKQTAACLGNDKFLSLVSCTCDKCTESCGLSADVCGAVACTSCSSKACPTETTACAGDAECSDCATNPSADPAKCSANTNVQALRQCTCNSNCGNNECQSLCSGAGGNGGAGGDAGAGGSDAGSGGDAGAGGSDAGAGGSDAGAGGSDAGAGGSDAGAGGSDAGSGGSDAGAGGDAGSGGSDAGSGGSDAGSGGTGGSGASISDVCLGCIGANCDSAFNACAGDPACLACATGDPTTAECLSNTNLLAAVACACQPAACGATDCSNECALFSGGQGGSGGAGGDAGAGGSDAGSGGSDVGGSGGQSQAPSFASDVKPILDVKCASCHTTGLSGGWQTSDFSTLQLNSGVCSGKTKGACVIERIKNGSMPQGGGCTGDPVQDANKSNCLTAAEQATIQAWVDGGQQP